jgi:hypothetical protein
MNVRKASDDKSSRMNISIGKLLFSCTTPGRKLVSIAPQPLMDVEAHAAVARRSLPKRARISGRRARLLNTKADATDARCKARGWAR